QDFQGGGHAGSVQREGEAKPYIIVAADHFSFGMHADLQIGAIPELLVQTESALQRALVAINILEASGPSSPAVGIQQRSPALPPAARPVRPGGVSTNIHEAVGVSLSQPGDGHVGRQVEVRHGAVAPALPYAVLRACDAGSPSTELSHVIATGEIGDRKRVV